MSGLGFISLLLVIAGTGFGSWHGALWWRNRTREPDSIDPRDQEIRELRAALSVTRKAVTELKAQQDQQTQTLAQAVAEATKAESALSNSQQKYNMTKDVLNKEIKARTDVQDELNVSRREIASLTARLHELEMQNALNESPILLPAETTQSPSTAVLETEISRWKRNCSLLVKSEKSLRAEVTRLSEMLTGNHLNNKSGAQ